MSEQEGYVPLTECREFAVKLKAHADRCEQEFKATKKETCKHLAEIYNTQSALLYSAIFADEASVITALMKERQR